ncbi:Trm112 family protein [bacterium]|nr:MAG: Trm112 family protein [bacterium]
MPLISELLQEVLVCPVCHGELENVESDGVLRCKNDGRTFPVRDGIPIMMVSDTEEPSSEKQPDPS